MSGLSPADLRWLDAAARLAMPYRGTTAENPAVGAIVVSPDGKMIGRGVTSRGGRPHAEPQALAMAGVAAQGASLYVTLEPCNHWGQTPPCVDAVLASGVSRVVCGAFDPDPRTAGASIAKLRGAGIAVDVGANVRSVGELHEGFFSRVTRGRPFVTAKLAVTRDGKIGLPDKGNVPITGELARRWTHMQRALSDAVIVGGRTALVDRPRLNVRLPGLEDRRPLRVFVLGRSQVNQIGQDSAQDAVLIVENAKSLGFQPELEPIESPSEDDRPNLLIGLEVLASRGIGLAFVEGGAGLNDALLDRGLVDRFHLLEGATELGEAGIPATVHASLPDRLQQLGFVVVDRRELGCDRLTTFEKKL